MKLEQCKVGMEISLLEDIECRASYYVSRFNLTVFTKGTKFKIMHVGSDDIGVYAMIKGKYEPNLYGADRCKWFEDCELQMFKPCVKFPKGLQDHIRYGDGNTN